MKEKNKEPLFHIVKRDALPWYKSLGIRFLAILLALILCGIITTITTGINPLQVYQSIVLGAFGSVRKTWVTFQGLVGNMDLTDNMMLRSFRQGHTPFTNRKPSKQLATDVVENLEVVTPGITTPVRRLSGGNVQKVLVGREIASAPTVLLTAYAVRGLDINSSYTIYDLINEQKKKGVAVIFVGEDLDVLMELSDRIMVLCGGEVSGILDARKTDKNEVGMLMTRVGGKEHEGEE